VVIVSPASQHFSALAKYDLKSFVRIKKINKILEFNNYLNNYLEIKDRQLKVTKEKLEKCNNLINFNYDLIWEFKKD
jgi:PIN domain nuclease of toxin-antitoxin system